jgi:hypothetical protein
LLYLTLNKPGKLPAYIRTLFGDKSNQAIAELVLDGILEIDSEGTFVSGPQAARVIHPESSPSAAQGTLAVRSIEALKYAQALDISHSQKLSARLYAYGRQPVSPEWQRRFPTPAAVAEHLGVRGRESSWLDKHWLSFPPSPASDPWLRWKLRHERPVLTKSELTYKLYVSPACEFVRDAFQTTVRIISELSAPCFKVGGDVQGLLRPDKIIVYLRSFEELQETSTFLSEKLNGCPAHGVPFTAEIAGNGLLSWGIDPPRDDPKPQWQGTESWRLWVTNRLAVGLLSAKAAPSQGVEPWQFALDCLRVEGVETETWTPTRAIWRDQLDGRDGRR